MKCLVLGGGGFLGSHLTDALLELGYHVRCFDRPLLKSSLSRVYVENPRFEFFEGDFLNADDISVALSGCDVCFHLISTTLPETSNVDPVFDVDSNVLSTVRLLDKAVMFGLKRIIFVSSGGTVYGQPKQLPIPETHQTEPLCSYGASKLSIEKYLAVFHRLYNLDFVVLRVANPFGERQLTNSSQGAIAVFLGKAIRSEPIEIWGDGSAVRDYIYISDVVDALVLSIGDTSCERVLNIGSGRGRSVNEILDMIEEVTGNPVSRRYLPSRPFDVPSNVLCTVRAKNSIGWVPKVSFEEGLLRVSHFLKTRLES